MASDDTSPGLPPKVRSPEKPKGVSRKKKSPIQTEVLEGAYAVEKYPSETTRTALSRELNLSEKQLQIWFTHRRYKDRRDGIGDIKLMANARRGKYDTQVQQQQPGSSKKGDIIDLNSREDDDSEDGYPAQVLAEEQYDEDLIAGNGGGEEFVKPRPKPAPRRRSGPRTPRDLSMPPRKPKLNAQVQAEHATLAAVENQLGGPLRDDGPPLGFDFDPLPPDAFQHLASSEAPFVTKGSREGVSEKFDKIGVESNAKRNQDYS